MYRLLLKGKRVTLHVGGRGQVLGHWAAEWYHHTDTHCGRLMEGRRGARDGRADVQSMAQDT